GARHRHYECLMVRCGVRRLWADWHVGWRLGYRSCIWRSACEGVCFLHDVLYVFASLVLVVAEPIVVHECCVALHGRLFHLWSTKSGGDCGSEACDQARGRFGRGADGFARLFEYGVVGSRHWRARSALWMGRRLFPVFCVRPGGHVAVCNLL